jgi:hypothetical protein
MKLEQAAQQAFETWWEREGQEFLFALNTTTDDDIKLVAEIAWKNGAYCAVQAEQEPVAWMRENEDCTDCFVWERDKEHTIPLYTTPPSVEAAIEATKEKAAKVCDDLYKHDRKDSGYDEGWNDALDIAEQAIRSMK